MTFNEFRRKFFKGRSKLIDGSFVMPSVVLKDKNKQHNDNLIGHGDFRYRVHKEWGNLNPSNTPVNNCH